MRFIGAAVCIASLALSVGGVSLREAVADPAETDVPVQEYAQSHSAQPKTCPLVRERPISVSIPLDRFEAAAAKADFVPLNTRGYNYRRPDDPPDRFVPDSTGRKTR